MSTSDNELIARFLAGDRRAANDLVRRYQSPIRQFLRRLTAGDHALADDIAQETFIRMLGALGSFRGDASLSTWLHTVAYRQFLRQVQANMRLEFVEEMEPHVEAVDASNAMSDVLLEQMMRHLTINERLAATLAFSAGMSHGEIADVTGMPLGTIKSHINRAKKKLARLLDIEEDIS
ncbi:RNA polymerase sigma-H factor [Xanthomonas sacchari]|uniref:RNA polymerase sigma factor n=1 Tax=Xanthomonas sacchari TaxID=56458 RepID=UPI0022518948|nr:sigma-70 family RNA polymerase sigma factor [Xanthomonas sacchari]MCW0397347.1 RNA polymerase sigma-H factor [Xanthomonas sacchari]MCW0445994.1 RNA polymerase sigma-H factor [Xanthomonas sacchari]MCW0464048.1 RNA polymerase sigma-H factor [Xanthomonas sacchari]